MDDKEMLSYIYQNADMGVDGVLRMLGKAAGSDLRGSLQSQLAAYNGIRSDALTLLRERGSEPEEPSPLNQLSSRVAAITEMLRNSTDEHIAEMMIQGSAMGLTKITKRLGDYEGGDREVRLLAGRLLSTEQLGIEQMKRFLN